MPHVAKTRGRPAPATPPAEPSGEGMEPHGADHVNLRTAPDAKGIRAGPVPAVRAGGLRADRDGDHMYDRPTPERPAGTAARGVAVAGLGALLVGLAGCSGGTTGPGTGCAVAPAEFVNGGLGRSEIPALTNPHVARPNTPSVAFIPEESRVIGIIFNDQPLAIPHRVLWHHEIVNLSIPGEQLTVTYSPLTGSSLVFDRLGPHVNTFRVSKYVLGSNLVMEDEGGTLWPQMAGAASCGPKDGVRLQRVHHEELSYAGWFAAYPDTWVVSSATGYDFLYTLYPYGDYEDLDNTSLQYPVQGVLDTRRPPKERVLGIPSPGGGLAVPLTLLDAQRPPQSPVAVANVTLDGDAIAVFWNLFAQAAIPFRAAVNGQTLTFETIGTERRDLETGSSWDLFGMSYEGPLEGVQLERVPDAYVAFWFAWAEFNPDTDLWNPPVTTSVAARPAGVPAPPTVDPSLYTR